LPGPFFVADGTEKKDFFTTVLHFPSDACKLPPGFGKPECLPSGQFRQPPPLWAVALL
jgi:hypothetical protein